ncbi:Sorbitol dehydrogenase [uncultured Ruminococcus sp.]|uniref:Alcohol dehydrogenase catalytic domain-containing protein n=1 Tax=Massiliimalia timonensis TaxID=1987501 RepID=A0A8J6P9P2_9FIRM|nr:alcohol dehydrogenase catalytic domain-containing protein [Massiliimalia timonensis]MBC8609682.1 alcohol dehydrogenase catalytic domain-containing protein [Massiliimalia timonensis]SCH31001.1 Sorbitol dehydrogenase [uncultured Ruminococcus sp.]SCH34551.1 Sorbitol dehydrogenase [uncultured Clostridium sp.]
MKQINRRLFLNKEHHLYLVKEEAPAPKGNEVLIKIASNGICGSDIHFFHEGRLGNFVVDEPYVPGHEASGTIIQNGPEAKRYAEGTRVVIEPGIPCGHCHFCKAGRYNLCPEVVFLSAPPINGTFCDYICVNENYVFPIPEDLSMEEAALAEPAAVAIHAVQRAQFRLGATGVVLGAGPIGLLTVQAFKAAGGGRVICVDVVEERLQAALRMGADEVIHAGSTETPMDNLGDVVFETAGNRVTTAQLFTVTRPGGCAVQVGWPNGNTVEMNIADMIDKELVYLSVNRYANAFDTALIWLGDGRINGREMITQRYTLEEAEEAFCWALEHPNETIKVIINNE